jgi:hypothetical protein
MPTVREPSSYCSFYFLTTTFIRFYTQEKIDYSIVFLDEEVLDQCLHLSFSKAFLVFLVTKESKRRKTNLIKAHHYFEVIGEIELTIENVKTILHQLERDFPYDEINLKVKLRLQQIVERQLKNFRSNKIDYSILLWIDPSNFYREIYQDVVDSSLFSANVNLRIPRLIGKSQEVFYLNRPLEIMENSQVLYLPGINFNLATDVRMNLLKSKFNPSVFYNNGLTPPSADFPTHYRVIFSHSFGVYNIKFFTADFIVIVAPSLGNWNLIWKFPNTDIEVCFPTLDRFAAKAQEMIVKGGYRVNFRRFTDRHSALGIFRMLCNK